MERQSTMLLAAVLVMTVAVAAISRGAEAAKSEDWETSLALGVHVTDGNSETLLGNVRLTAQREIDKDSYRLSLEGVYGENTTMNALGVKEDQTTTQNAKAAASYRRALNDAYIYVDSSVLHDDIAAVDYRAVAGVGLGYSLVKADETKVGVEGGAAYVWEDVADTRDSYLALRVAVLSEWRLSETAKVWANVEYLPRGDDLDDYLLSGEVGIEAAIDSSMSLQLVVKDRQDSTPAPGLEENDLAVISALSWKL